MSIALERLCSTVDVEVAWLDKLNEEKCDIDKVMSRLKRDVRIIKRNYIECTQRECFIPEIMEFESAVKDIEELSAITGIYKRMLTRLLEQIKSYFMSEFKYSYYNFGFNRYGKVLVEKIMDIRCLSNRKLNIFFPNINNLYVLDERFKEKFNTYASAETDEMYSSLKNQVDYRILGELRHGSLISNNFDVLFMRAEIQTRLEINKDIEKISIMNTIKYLRNGGIFILEIPYSRLSDDLLLMLSKKISNIQFIKEDDQYNTIFITGVKVDFKSANDSAETYDYLISKMDLNYFYELNDKLDFSLYTVPSEELEISLFRGSRVSKEEMCEYCRDSGLIDSFLKEEKEIEERDTHPLLPFNIGQVGLVLTSSELNGIVKDDKGIPHLIKGMTIKDTNTSEEHEGNEIRSTEVVANRVQINIMSADGRIIKIS